MRLRRRNMIKKWIEKIFGKFCKCEEVDEHITMYTETPEPEIKVVCEKHLDSFKKTCPSCREAK
jgi:hypothetical protein